MLLAAAGTGLPPGGPAPVGFYQAARGTRFYVTKVGAGPPLIYLHGAMQVAEDAARLATFLSASHTVYVPERRGVGRTADRAGDWTYVDMAADMAALMDALGVASAPVIGLSDGAIIGLILAGQRPDLVSRLLATGANTNPEGLGDFLSVVRSATPEQLLAGAPPQVQRFAAIQRQVSPDRGAALIASVGKMQRMWLNFEIPQAALGRIKAPTLVAAADGDTIPVEHTAGIWRAIPGAQLMIVPGADHFWITDTPEREADVLAGFFGIARR